MQLHMELVGRDIVLPIAYRRLIHGLIYNTLAECASPEEAGRLHDAGYAGADGRGFRLFTFSPLRGQYQVTGRQITFTGRVGLEIRSPDARLINALARGWSAGGTIRLGHNLLRPAAIRIEDKHCLKNHVRCSTISPLTAYITRRDGHTVFLSPRDRAFWSAIVRNAGRKWSVFRPGDTSFSLEAAPLPDSRWRREVTRFKNTFVTAWYGDFGLRGTPELIDLLYQSGAGAKNSEGFGMFEIMP